MFPNERLQVLGSVSRQSKVYCSLRRRTWYEYHDDGRWKCCGWHFDECDEYQHIKAVGDMPPKHTTNVLQRTASFDLQNIRSTSYGQRWNAWKETFLTLDQRKVFNTKEARTLNNWAKKEDDAYPWGVIESGAPFSCSLALRPLLLHYRPFLPIRFFQFNEHKLDKNISTVNGRSCVVLRRATYTELLATKSAQCSCFDTWRWQAVIRQCCCIGPPQTARRYESGSRQQPTHHNSLRAFDSPLAAS